ncbi:hypothetical protein TPHA_0O00800 [Tetrapisispora phaffii CBS 4417]|uniref:Major facilitator superfamily (MFS) profile domain-containing protein n=1 Tax=Tetrapisispora phaffii (strain ATCC 24235 / CBS 4417 / NBRC 1672 / NRRL Y-8282 / UCD 70-5) TaxID=1071381 RepID=G8C1M1_TETPH|nr:hypothetical protein TPHA_0O00800 [Tetrapisispora phaffii CBS 4417]CCE66049.1 hypothetical protein TPHA_0O00800 [Tetrapisispora phaffii CBS 4417]
MAKKSLTFNEQMKGFPWYQLFFLSMIRIVEPMSFTSLFPYVYYMVKDFHVSPDNAQVSKYSGYLASCFALCQVLTAYNWSKVSQQYGRKPTLLLGLFGTGISLLVLGFAKYYYQTLLARGMMGLLNGNVSIIRTVIGELATERRYQGVAFSMLPLLFETGAVIGPMVGGYLVFREENNTYPPNWFPASVKRLVKIYPYSLPNIAIFAYILISILVNFLFLEETHPDYKNRKDYGLIIGDFIKKHIFSIKVKQRAWNTNYAGNHSNVDPEQDHIINETTPLVHSSTTQEISSPYHRNNMTENIDHDDIDESENTSEAESIQSLPLLTRRESVALIRTYSIVENTDITPTDTNVAFDGCAENSAIHHVLHTSVFYPISVSFIMALHTIVFNEFLPIFLAYELEKDPSDSTQLVSKFPWKISGGIGYSSEQTGTLLSTTGIFGVLVVIFIFPTIDRKYDCLTIFRTLVKIYPVLYLIIPYVVFLQKDWIPRWATVCYLYFITGSKTLCSSLTNPQITLLIHNSSPLSCRAVINGATISISSSARFVGPLIWGYLMSWTQEYEIAWLGWWSLGIISAIAWLQSYKIDPIDDEDEEEEDNENTGSMRRRTLLERSSSLRSLRNKSKVSLHGG